ncbi:hypothetical protein B0F90DRAFT_1666604 [Multifurca ochricompacta]|uniref:Uncharacterized protein n=1 Tax=Multifurca ochricompacta TaxID=376703 RepID=A0AAD4M889_9AGAM|nr:hypothetical protein B0F90DRAFT_1666604 [Multifurca ochricompacta]
MYCDWYDDFVVRPPRTQNWFRAVYWIYQLGDILLGGDGDSNFPSSHTRPEASLPVKVLAIMNSNEVGQYLKHRTDPAAAFMTERAASHAIWHPPLRVGLTCVDLDFELKNSAKYHYYSSAESPTPVGRDSQISGFSELAETSDVHDPLQWLDKNKARPLGIGTGVHRQRTRVVQKWMWGA